MSLGHVEALYSARQVCRTLASAPVPQARCREIFGLLVRAEGWSPGQERQITTFGAWHDERPSPGALKPACEELLTKLGR